MRTTINLLLLLALVFGLAGCCVCPEADQAIQDGIAVNAGHMADDGLPQEARDIAQDNHDLLWSVRYRMGAVDELPADVRARKDDRAGGGQ